MNADKEFSRLVVLGAGASVDCGVYPLGSDLINISKNLLPLCYANHEGKFGEDLVEKLVQSQANQIHIRDKIKRFVPRVINNLVNSSHASVDSHIVYIKNTEERNFLKSLILSVILSCTAYSNLEKSFDQNWYSEIAKLILPTLSNGANDADRLEAIEKKIANLQIVTFNYDVSLELYLLDRLQDFFGEKFESPKPFNPYSKRALRKIMDKIHHVYGRVYDCDEVFWVHNQMNFSGSTKESFECLWQEELKNRQGTASRRPAKSFRDLIDSHQEHRFHRSIFLFLILKYALRIDDPSNNKIGDMELSQDRIMVIKEDERSLEIEKDLQVKINNNGNSWDLVYILGYGFDHDNNKLLNFDKIRNYKHGCFVTNYANDESKINQRLQRLILDELLSEETGFTKGDSKCYKVPYISHKSVSEALKQDFSLLENPTSPLKIQTNLTPYLELKK